MKKCCKYIGVVISSLFIAASALANDPIIVDNESYVGYRTISEDPEIYGSQLSLIKVVDGSQLSVSNSLFENNYAYQNTIGVYGLAIGAVGNGTSVSIDSTMFSGNIAESPGQAFGTIWAGSYSSFEISNSTFTNNTGNGNEEACGGAISSWGANLSVKDSAFTGNRVDSLGNASGGAIYSQGGDWTGFNPSELLIENCTFDSNIASSDYYARGGAVFVISMRREGIDYPISAEIKDSSFNNNLAYSPEGWAAWKGGGAIYNYDSEINIIATKNITNFGNQAFLGSEAVDSQGGFLMMRSINNGAKVNFDISENATYTIGNELAAGYDSIASNDSRAIISKTGAGTLTVNSSMQYYTGLLNVTAGTMNVNNGLGGKALVSGVGSTLNLDNASYVNKGTLNTTEDGWALSLIRAWDGSKLSVSNSLFEINHTSQNFIDYQGVYGSVISASGTAENITNVSIDSSTFKGNVADTLSKMQGIVWAGEFSSFEITNSTFENNYGIGETQATGGAVSSWGSDVVVKDSVFIGNNVYGKTVFAAGGAIYTQSANWGGLSPSSLIIENSTFDNNSANSEIRASGGAIQISTVAPTSVSAQITDSVFTNNRLVLTVAGSTVLNAFGGAICSRRSDVTFNISEGKNLAYTGNEVIFNGAKSDAGGGFMYLFSDGTGTARTTFNIGNSASLTIGDGRTGYDSIASNNAQAEINKTGVGALTVNSSMQYFTGLLNVTAGTMNVNNGLGGKAEVLFGSDNPTLNISNMHTGNKVMKFDPATDTYNWGAHYSLIRTEGHYPDNNFTATIRISNSSFTNFTILDEKAEFATSTLCGGLISANGTDLNSKVFISDTDFKNNVTTATNGHLQGALICNAGGSNFGDGAEFNISNSKFLDNIATNSASYIVGGVFGAWGGLNNIDGSTFSNNQITSVVSVARGGAIGVDYGTILNISNSSLDRNSATSLADIARGGAISMGGTNRNGNNSMNIIDTSFTNNFVASNVDAVGGAISERRGTISYKVTDGKNITNVGNYVLLNEAKNDSKGGFLYMFSDEQGIAQTTFNIGNNASLTIGDGRAGYDSIASNNAQAEINKTGAGALTVNSSMEYYTGVLNVTEGVMQANNKLGASAITIAAGATLGLKIAGDNTLTNTALSFANNGTLILNPALDLAPKIEGYAISATAGLNYGNVVSYGGTYSEGIFAMGTRTEFTSSEIQTSPILDIVAGSNITITDDIEGTPNQTIAIATLGSGNTIFLNRAEVANFLDPEYQITMPLQPNEKIVTAWTFDILGVNSDNSVVLSFILGGDLNMADVNIWHKDGNDVWENITASLQGLTYSNGALSFVATAFSDYAITAVPEPASLALLGISLLVATVLRKRKIS